MTIQTKTSQLGALCGLRNRRKKYNQKVIACSLNWPHIECNQSYPTSLSAADSSSEGGKCSHFGMEMKHKITVKRRHSSPRGGSGRRARDRGEAAKQFNPPPISCESPLILMQRYRPPLPYMSLNPHYSTA